MLKTSLMENFIVVDLEILYKKLAEEDFHERYECRYEWNELYEQIDDTGEWYLKDDYALILTGMEQEWKERILCAEKETLHSIINLN